MQMWILQSLEKTLGNFMHFYAQNIYENNNDWQWYIFYHLLTHTPSEPKSRVLGHVIAWGRVCVSRRRPVNRRSSNIGSITSGHLYTLTLVCTVDTKAPRESQMKANQYLASEGYNWKKSHGNLYKLEAKQKKCHNKKKTIKWLILYSGVVFLCKWNDVLFLIKENHISLHRSVSC